MLWNYLKTPQMQALGHKMNSGDPWGALWPLLWACELIIYEKSKENVHKWWKYEVRLGYVGQYETQKNLCIFRKIWVQERTL